MIGLGGKPLTCCLVGKESAAQEPLSASKAEFNQMMLAWPRASLHKVSSLDMLQKLTLLGPAAFVEEKALKKREEDTLRKRKQKEKHAMEKRRKEEQEAAAKAKAQEEAKVAAEKAAAAAAAAATAKAQVEAKKAQQERAKEHKELPRRQCAGRNSVAETQSLQVSACEVIPDHEMCHLTCS